MSDPTEPITPGVKKTTRRFAPVKRGASKTAAGLKREEAAKAAAAAASATEGSTTTTNEGEGSTSTNGTTETQQQHVKSQPIGTMRPEGVSSGRLQSVNDGQKTRGGAAKMKFKPTIPHKRNKKEVSSSTIDEALNSKPGHHGNDRGRGGGGRGRGDRGGGRGRGRGRGLVIVDESTASGFFSLGPSAVSRGRPGFGGSGGGFASYGGDVPSRAEGDSENSDMVEMFTNSIGKDTPVTFRHVSRLEGDIDPVTLSQHVGKIPWMTVRSKKEKKSKDVKVVKPEPNSSMDVEEGSKTPMILSDDEDEEEEEVTLPKVYMDGDSPAQNIFALNEKEQLVCVAEEELLYFQLPTVVPKFEKPKDDSTITLDKTDADMDTDTAAAVKSETTEQLPPAAKKSTLAEAMQNLDLEDMPEGQIGKLIIYKSGKVKMKFGSILLDVNQGMQSSFLENIMVVDHESEETKKAIELGHIVQKFVCNPNMDALLKEDEEALN